MALWELTSTYVGLPGSHYDYRRLPRHRSCVWSPLSIIRLAESRIEIDVITCLVPFIISTLRPVSALAGAALGQPVIGQLSIIFYHQSLPELARILQP